MIEYPLESAEWSGAEGLAAFPTTQYDKIVEMIDAINAGGGGGVIPGDVILKAPINATGGVPFPAAIAGDLIPISGAGYVGPVNAMDPGVAVTLGTLMLCITTNGGGNNNQVGAYWIITLPATTLLASATSSATSIANGISYPASGGAVGALAPVEIDFRTGGLKKVILLTTNANGGNFTLPAGNIIGALDSMELTLVLSGFDINTAIITPSNLLGGTTITMANVGESVTLIYNEIISKWIIKSVYGSIIS